jgi:hypothetical protein
MTYRLRRDPFQAVIAAKDFASLAAHSCTDVNTSNHQYDGEQQM